MTEVEEEVQNEQNIFQRVLHNKPKPQQFESETMVEFITKTENLTQPAPNESENTPRQFEKDGYFGDLLDEAVISSTQNLRNHLRGSQQKQKILVDLLQQQRRSFQVQVSVDEGKTNTAATLKNGVLHYNNRQISIDKSRVVILKQTTLLLDGDLQLKFKSVNDLQAFL